MPLTPTQTRSLLEQLGVSPRKSLGQNFLTDGNLAHKSVALAEISPGDVVVEIGPGLGTLTEALLAAGAEVFAVEVDPRLAAHLRATPPTDRAQASAVNFHLLEADAVAHPRAGLPETHPARASGAFKVVANLPYAVSTPWLDALLGGPLPSRLVLMLQREAAARFTTAPGTAARGAISIFVEAAYARAASHPVSRRCFYPEPGVDSTLLAFARRSDARAFHPATKSWIRAFFTRRRQQLGRLVRQLPATPTLDRKVEAPNSKLEPVFAAWLERLPAHKLDARARPEDVPLAAWLELDALMCALILPRRGAS